MENEKQEINNPLERANDHLSAGQRSVDQPGQSLPDEHRKSKIGLWLVMAAVLLALAGIIIYNSLHKVNNQNKSNREAFPLSLEQVRTDFENKEKRLKSDVQPPAAYVERFSQPLKISLAAIEHGLPSQPDFKDLSEDYLNIASIHSILGDYQQSEEWYLKTLEKWPDNYKALLNLADLYIMMGQSRSAAERFYHTAVLFPMDYRVYNKFADFYYKYSSASDGILKAELIYEWGIKHADDAKLVYKEYSFFLENYAQNYGKALEMERGYQLSGGEASPEAIERLERLIEKNK